MARIGTVDPQSRRAVTRAFCQSQNSDMCSRWFHEIRVHKERRCCWIPLPNIAASKSFQTASISITYFSTHLPSKFVSKMRFSSPIVVFTLASRAVAAPILERDVPEKRAPLTDLSSDLVGLLISLGLGEPAPPVGGTVDTLGVNDKKRGLITDLSPEIAALLTSLGLGELAGPVGDIVDTLGNDI